MSARRASPKAKGKGRAKPRAKVRVIRLPPEEPGATGRPSLLTDAVATKICAGLRRGLSRTSAAALCGITRHSIHDWFARGEGRDRHGRPASARFAAFVQHAREAEAEHEDMLLTRLQASGDPKMDLAILERRHRDDWHLSTRVEATVTHETGATLREAIERIAAAVSEAEGDGGPEPR